MNTDRQTRFHDAMGMPYPPHLILAILGKRPKRPKYTLAKVTVEKDPWYNSRREVRLDGEQAQRGTYIRKVNYTAGGWMLNVNSSPVGRFESITAAKTALIAVVLYGAVYGSCCGDYGPAVLVSGPEWAPGQEGWWDADADHRKAWLKLEKGERPTWAIRLLHRGIKAARRRGSWSLG